MRLPSMRFYATPFYFLRYLSTIFYNGKLFLTFLSFYGILTMPNPATAYLERLVDSYYR